MEEIKNWLTDTCKLLVDNPDAVRVESKTDEMGVLFTIFVGEYQGKLEAGKIIGKEGVRANALRNIILAMGAKRSVKVSLKVDAPKYDRPHDKETLGI